MKKLIIMALIAAINSCAYADAYVYTPQGLVTVMNAGGKDLLINNPNGGAILCLNAGDSYICNGGE